FAPAPVGSTASPLVTPGTPGRSERIPTAGAVREGQLRRPRAWEAWLRRQALAPAPKHSARDAAIAGTNAHAGRFARRCSNAERSEPSSLPLGRPPARRITPHYMPCPTGAQLSLPHTLSGI